MIQARFVHLEGALTALGGELPPCLEIFRLVRGARHAGWVFFAQENWLRRKLRVASTQLQNVFWYAFWTRRRRVLSTREEH